jgi:DNA-binding transcriptional LysR family regulator
VADGDLDLVQCLPPRTDHGRVLWLFTHDRCRHSPKVRTVIDFLYEGLRRHIMQLEEKRVAA